MAMEELRRNGMMARLLDALASGKDIGHYGRSVLAEIGAVLLLFSVGLETRVVGSSQSVLQHFGRDSSGGSDECRRCAESIGF